MVKAVFQWFFTFDVSGGCIIQLQRMKSLMPVLILIGLLFTSCAGTDPVDEPETAPVAEEPAPEPEPVPEPEPATGVEDTTDNEFEVSQEIYDQTFNEIEALIYELNTVISRKQYDRWLTYLSNNYKRTFNSRETLDEINQYPQLKDNGIVLTDLKDYFDWVVVPSRSQAILGDIVFVGESRVIAYSSYQGKRAKLYELERIDGEWKITVW